MAGGAVVAQPGEDGSALWKNRAKYRAHMRVRHANCSRDYETVRRNLEHQMPTRRAMMNTVSFLLAGIFLGGSPAIAATLTVTTTADAGPGSLRDALVQSRAGDTIILATEGTIALTTGPLLVRQNVTITGPGRSVLAISAGGPFRVFVVGDAGPVTAVMSGVTIRDGSGDTGGGVLNRGTLTLTDVAITANRGTWGGGIYNAGTLTLSDSTISGNTSIAHGGGIYNAAGRDLTMNRTQVSDNTGAVGGGMTNDGGYAKVFASTFTNNSAIQSGAGSGGAIYNGGLAGSLTITASTIARNWTDGDGGAIYTIMSSLTMVRSTVAGNWSACAIGGCVGGGGIVAHTSRAAVTDSTLSGNVTLRYPFLGGNLASFYTTVTLKHSILAGPGHNCRSYLPTEIASAGYNLSDDETCVASLTGAGDVNGVPAGLSPSGLRDNGGLTETIALLPTSPAVDAVPIDACAATDQRGVSRPQALACDIGAFELVMIPATLDLAPPAPSSFVAGWLGPLTLSAAMRRTDVMAPIAGAEVSFLLDGVRIGTATTDGTGTASFSRDPSLLPAGTHSVQAIALRQTLDDETFDEAASGVQQLQVTPSPYSAQALQPIRADGTSVFNLNRSVVPVKFALTYNDAATCDLPPATVMVARLSGTAPGPVNESDYVMTADDGVNFRVDSCHYVYNLASTSLGPGTYVVSIVVQSTIVGRATFGLQ